MPQTLVLEDVVDSAFDVALRNVWTAMPAQVESYDPELQTADVQIAVQNGTFTESGDRRTETIAIVTSVPVIHAGGGGFRAIFPVKRGDTVFLVFASRALARWLANGGIVDPKSDHHHDISDAVAITGLRDFKHVLENVPTDHASVGYDGGASIEYYQNEIRVGGDVGTQPTLKATLFMTALDTLLQALVSAVNTIPGGNPAGSAIATAIGVFNSAAPGFTTIVAKVV